VAAPRIAILADDLIWAMRLAAIVREAGAMPVAARSMAALRTALEGGVDLAIVDLTARAYDGVEAIVTAVAAGAAVLAVGQHDDVALRRRALAAGAARVVPYRLLAGSAGPTVVARWSAAAKAGREAHAEAGAEARP
jgi:DNA-binding response OmpR family regulator